MADEVQPAPKSEKKVRVKQTEEEKKLKRREYNKRCYMKERVKNKVTNTDTASK